MAAISSDIEVEVQPSPRNTRVNEIVAIALVALDYCCSSASSHTTQMICHGMPPVNRAPQLDGAVGANVARHCSNRLAWPPICCRFCFWRRLEALPLTPHQCPVSRVAGLILLVLSSSALLALAHLRLF